ncbi:MAG: HAMP domain-containing histidine kinase [Pseudomonadota bacterium]|nr:HAMP domain-containing histidine kinase [Pseudomonadota bacterium]
MSNLAEIVDEWTIFAASLEPIGELGSASELRDHAKDMLKAIALDMETVESPAQKKSKSTGDVSKISGADSAASAHGATRQVSDFTMPQLTAEFRAMRATVLRLWMAQVVKVTPATVNDMTRFNEAIDQALQESAIKYADQTERTRDTFLAMLGHDLRSPLATMTMAGTFLTRPGEGTEQTLQIGARVKRSAATMTTMVNDLLEYARTQLGGKMPVTPILGDMLAICQAAIADASAAHPACPFELQTAGEMIGDFDSPRLEQVISNLLNNAAQYRGKQHPVTVIATGDADAITVQVINFGTQIPSASLKAVFDPMVQLTVNATQNRARTSLGLGLFIAREITLAHGGTIQAESGTKAGTVFTVRLPKLSPAIT